MDKKVLFKVECRFAHTLYAFTSFNLDTEVFATDDYEAIELIKEKIKYLINDNVTLYAIRAYPVQ